MKIYTRSGDHGETGLIGGIRVPKNHIAVCACGELDETNSCIGLAVSIGLDEEIARMLIQVQHDLFVLGSQVAEYQAESNRAARLDKDRIQWLEDLIDRLDSKLPALDAFILPGGVTPAAQLHFARSVCRRAERSIVAMQSSVESEKSLSNVVTYLNRLSDLLFVLGRFVNHQNNVQETRWLP